MADVFSGSAYSRSLLCQWHGPGIWDLSCQISTSCFKPSATSRVQLDLPQTLAYHPSFHLLGVWKVQHLHSWTFLPHRIWSQAIDEAFGWLTSSYLVISVETGQIWVQSQRKTPLCGWHPLPSPDYWKQSSGWSGSICEKHLSTFYTPCRGCVQTGPNWKYWMCTSERVTLVMERFWTQTLLES